jgi:OmpA family
MYSRISKLTCLAVTLACASLMPVALAAQESAKPSTKAPSANSPSKWDIFAGYSYLAPKGDLVKPGNALGVPPDTAKSVDLGAIGSVTRYFTNNFGVQGEGDYHNMHNESTPNNDFSGGSGGLVFRFPTEDITPFVHALVGAESVGSYYYTNKWGVVLTAGGGLDYHTPLFNRHLSIRVFQADYQYTHENFYPVARGNFNMARLSAGLVANLGTIAPPPPPTMACAASPSSVFPGDPVTVTATPEGLNPKWNALYTWTGDGLTGTGTTANVNTGALSPGTYTVKGNLKEGKAGKEGLKPWQVADCSATYTVKEFEPPTISCSANPTTIKPGESATITAQGVSPQNRPLTYTYTASAGTVSGSGTTATLASTGASPGPIQITGTVTDDKGHTASCNTSVTVEAPPPPPPPPPASLTLHSVFFPTALPNEKRPEGGLADSQMQILNTLATDFKNYLALKSDAHLTLTGHTDPRGGAKYNQALSERRVNRVKQYLIEQGVPESAISTNAVGETEMLTKDQVKDQIQSNPELSDDEKKKIMRQFNVIYLAKNRRVDIRLNNGQESAQSYPFNAKDAETLLSTAPQAHARKHPAEPKKK